LGLSIFTGAPTLSARIAGVSLDAGFSDGDFVILHVHSVRDPGTRGDAIIDLFKLENGKIVEHWDVVQPIPEKIVHNNSMF
jgi:predicted SnoaL-like aldol condensation-catalyzing enzyme